MTTIHLVNHSTYIGPEFTGLTSAFVAALNQYAAKLAPWGVGAKVQTAAKTSSWRMVFLNDADQADALGYHEFYRGKPLAKIFVKTCIADNSSVSVCATHELAEMLCDPDASQAVQGQYKGKDAQYAKEVCDAVEETDFNINGFRMSNFVLPEWFQGNIAHAPGTKFDYLGLCTEPFQILKGGYMPINYGGGWTQIFGSKAKEKRWKREDRRGHRIEDLRK